MRIAQPITNIQVFHPTLCSSADRPSYADDVSAKERRATEYTKANDNTLKKTHTNKVTTIPRQDLLPYIPVIWLLYGKFSSAERQSVAVMWEQVTYRHQTAIPRPTCISLEKECAQRHENTMPTSTVTSVGSYISEEVVPRYVTQDLRREPHTTSVTDDAGDDTHIHRRSRRDITIPRCRQSGN